MKGQEMPEIKLPEVIRHKGDSYVTFYTNNAQIEANPWDLKLVFGEIEKTEMVPGGEGAPKIYVEDKARIVMSPQHAKALMKALQENLAQYEAQMGPIPEPSQSK
jgi:hypothetical protein